MGLFDAFKKKDCEICGKEVGIFGYKKLEDGEICKDCVKLLSPWFDDRRHSTVEQIKRQLTAREENRRKLQTWSHNRCFGEWQKIYIRMENGIPESFVVSSDPDYKDANADIISFAEVSSCDVDIHESHSELKQTNDKGERVSYNPPRFEYDYDFYIKLGIVGIEYIDDIRFRINRSTLHLETVQNRGIFSKAFDPMLYPEYRQYSSQCDELSELFQAGMNRQPYGSASGACADPVPAMMCTPSNTAPASASVWTCDSCGSENTGKFCQGCGAPKPVSPAAGWRCSCGAVNTGKFCEECGKRFNADNL